ncbi:R-spondin-2, partial [Eschrichtius robustus]|nr:R-spondin-2 [Eschrichtius robustus]
MARVKGTHGDEVRIVDGSSSPPPSVLVLLIHCNSFSHDRQLLEQEAVSGFPYLHSTPAFRIPIELTGCRIENCDSCFSKDFCTKCKVGFYLHRGRCFEECPDGFAPLDETMECVEGCEVGHWSEWGTCSRNNRTCGFKWGLETRTRQIVKKPAKDTIPCPTIAESRRCKMAMRHCPGADAASPKMKLGFF